MEHSEDADVMEVRFGEEPAVLPADLLPEHRNDVRLPPLLATDAGTKCEKDRSEER